MDKTVSACTADLCDQYGGRLAVSASPLRHFGGVRAFSGAAVTLRSHEDNVRLKELIARDGRGRVIVVDAGGRANCAMVGGDMAARALDHGWTGLVILGGVREALWPSCASWRSASWHSVPVRARAVRMASARLASRST